MNASKTLSFVAIGLFATILVGLQSGGAIAQNESRTSPTNPINPTEATTESRESGLSRLPFLPHLAPDALTAWQTGIDPDDRAAAGDYFSELDEFSFGVLTWSRWPVRVSIDPTAPETWQADVRAALADWQVYIPMEILTAADAIAPDDLEYFMRDDTRPPDESAVDIAIVRTIVPARRTATGDFRAASARAQPHLFVERDPIENRERFNHRFTIRVNPTQHSAGLRSAIRHEFGHALGIWGHSDDPNDVMFAAQVGQPGTVSVRDLNTLLHVYEQPTRIGWWIAIEPEQ